MKISVISLWQPWASLVAAGIKTIETRKDPAPAELVGQRVAIHSASKRSRAQVVRWLKQSYPDQLAKVCGEDDPESLPTGVVLATAVLRETREADCRDWPQTLSPVEDLFAWVLDDIRLLKEPIPLDQTSPDGLFEAELELG